MSIFLTGERPVLTAMLRARSTEALIEEVKLALDEGCEAFGFQIEALPPEYKKPSEFRKVIAAMGDKPAYVTNYRRCNNQKELTDERLAEQLLELLDCGAVLIDVFGDIFDPTPGEITWNEAAAERQTRLIEEIHRRGGEVLMSSHVLRFAPTDEVTAIANAHKARGADISKIVTNADNDAELAENFSITMKLKRELGIPSLFLCNGSDWKRHRLYAPPLGSCMFLCVPGEPSANNNQPPLKKARAVLELLS